MERTIIYTTASELKRAEEESKKRGHAPITIRGDRMVVEGTHRDIEQTIQRLKNDGHEVHRVDVQNQCEHCHGRGHRTVLDVSFDEVIHSETKPVRSDPTNPQREASRIP